MIYVTVGTHYLGFERLIKKMDEIAGKIDEEVIAQIGSTKYKPKNMKYFKFIKEEEKILELYKKARIVLSHSGVGTILTVLNYGKPLVIVPRLKKFNEHIDDHQIELAEMLKNEEGVQVVYDTDKLEHSLNNAKPRKFKKSIKNKNLVNFLKNYIMVIENENMHGDINTISS